jgi:hypothetical protein
MSSLTLVLMMIGALLGASSLGLYLVVASERTIRRLNVRSSMRLKDVLS